MSRVSVHTPSRSYEVLIERGLLRSASPALRATLPVDTRLFLLTTAPVRKHWANVLRKGLRKGGYSVDIIEMPDGERAKSLTQLERLADELVASGADRHSAIVALGGGVVGDVGGFVASVYMRGIPVVHVPTTLLAQVDSAIGGKTGVNLKAGKNLLGTFHQPLAVLVDPDVLTTLPEREYRAGLFEAMKYGVIRNPSVFEMFERNRDDLLRRDGELLETLIAECIRIKAGVVSSDERESGERRILNFGHTIGHALEAETGYKRLLHGEAVAWGMIAAAKIGADTGITPLAVAKRIEELVISYGHLPKLDVNPKSVFKRLSYDKKAVRGVPHFVLASGMGKVQIVGDVPANCVIEAIKHVRTLSRA